MCGRGGGREGRGGRGSWVDIGEDVLAGGGEKGGGGGRDREGGIEEEGGESKETPLSLRVCAFLFTLQFHSQK